MARVPVTPLSGDVLGDEIEVSIGELCRTCGVPAEVVVEMVEHGIIEPRGRNMAQWSFSGSSLVRVTTVLRLRRDLDLNLAGAALAVELLEEVRHLRRKLRALETSMPGIG